MLVLSFLHFYILHGNNRTGNKVTTHTCTLSPVHCMSVCQCLVDGIPYSRSCLWLGGCVVANNLKEWDALVSTCMFGQHLSIQEIVFPLLSGFTVGKCDPVCSIIPSCLYPHLSLQCAMKSGRLGMGLKGS